MALVSTTRCLYITYYVAKIIRRVPLDSSAVTQWKTDSEPDGIAHVANSANVIVALRLVDKLVVYQPDGGTVNTIELPLNTVPRYALPFQGDKFLVYGGLRPFHLYLCDKHGNAERCIDTKTRPAILGASIRRSTAMSSDPPGIAVDRRGGNVLVADHGRGKVRMLDSNLRYVCDAVRASEGVKNPCKLCLDDECETLYIAELSNKGRVLAYSVTRA